MDKSQVESKIHERRKMLETDMASTLAKIKELRQELLGLEIAEGVIEQLLTQTLLFDIIISPDTVVKAGSNYCVLLKAIREKNRQLLSTQNGDQQW